MPARGSSSISSTTASVTEARIGRHVVEVDAGDRLRGDGPEERGAQVVGGDAREQVGGELEEPLLGPGDAGEGAAGLVGQARAGRPPRP